MLYQLPTNQVGINKDYGWRPGGLKVIPNQSLPTTEVLAHYDNPFLIAVKKAREDYTIYLFTLKVIQRITVQCQ